MKPLKKLSLVALLALTAAHTANATSIWGSTDRGPALGAYRMPVDTGSSSSPGYISVTELQTYMGANLSFNLGAGFTITPGTANAAPLVSGGTLYGQLFPNIYTGSHTVTAAEIGGIDICNSSTGTVTMTVPQAGTAGFEAGNSISFGNINSSNCLLTTTISAFNGMQTSGGNITLSQYGYASCTADVVGNWDCLGTPAGIQAASTITSSSSTAFTVGANGVTNPAFNVDASTASSATGVVVKSAATGGTTTITETDSGANSSLTIAAKGTGTLSIGNGGTSSPIALNGKSWALQVNSASVISATNAGAEILVAPVAESSNTFSPWTYNGSAGTTLSTTVEVPIEFWNNVNATRGHNTGAISMQRDFLVNGATDNFVGASTLTNGATMGLVLKSCGTNGTCTNESGLFIPSTAITGTVANSYAVNVAAATGATNNYAANLTGTVALTPGATLPVVSSCGSGTLTTGSGDNKGSITGITAAAACTITFGTPLTAAPVCEFTGSAALAGFLISSISTTAVTTGMTAFTGTLYYQCF